MITVDKDKIVVTENGSQSEYDIGSKEAFEIISQLWLRSGWDTKYVYSFSWLGRPIIQLPEDMMRIQEVIYTVKPDVILETGIAHGGSLVFYATLFKAIGKGRVIGLDIEIRPHNRQAIEAHELFSYITLIEGDSIDEQTVRNVKSLIQPDEKVLVVLDSNHSKEHVLSELNAYSELVNVNSYIVASDGIMKDLTGAPRSDKDWSWNNPVSAVRQFLKSNKNFVIEEPAFPFNEGIITKRVTYWPGAFLKRIK
ncbi:MAG: hydroxylase [Planctomycetes bacterium]|nr:hydroxylase [Planctomycetota bacterium]